MLNLKKWTANIPLKQYPHNTFILFSTIPMKFNNENRKTFSLIVFRTKYSFWYGIDFIGFHWSEINLCGLNVILRFEFCPILGRVNICGLLSICIESVLTRKIIS